MVFRQLLSPGVTGPFLACLLFETDKLEVRQPYSGWLAFYSQSLTLNPEYLEMERPPPTHPHTHLHYTPWASARCPCARLNQEVLYCTIKPYSGTGHLEQRPLCWHVLKCEFHVRIRFLKNQILNVYAVITSCNFFAFFYFFFNA